tara:strand:+ start:29228 stop:29701 length:474 start_codon:yes stop_codon:yes gene_type:complete
MEKNNKKIFMLLALEEAKISASKGEVPVGAVTVKNNEVIAKSGNRMENTDDPLQHAEMIVLKNTADILKNMGLSIKYEKIDLYVTLEPCTMCAYAISLCRIENLIYGADDPKRGGINFGSKVFQQSTCHHKPNIFSGIRKNDSEQLLKEFFIKLRKK